MTEKTSKDLLKLEANAPAVESTSSLESKLSVCKKDRPFSMSEAPLHKPTMFPVPKSNVLGKVHDFLGVMSESNKKLLDKAKDNPESCNIEVLHGKESGYIVMDLMLGVADLHTPEAVAAAESAMAGRAPLIPLGESESESEDSSDDDDDDDEKEEKINRQDYKAGSQSTTIGSKDEEMDSLPKPLRKHKPKKRSKIVELS